MFRASRLPKPSSGRKTSGIIVKLTSGVMQELMPPADEDLLSNLLRDTVLLAILPELPAATLAHLRRTCRSMLDDVSSLHAWSAAARPLLRRAQQSPTQKAFEHCNSRHEPPVEEQLSDARKACPQDLQQQLRDQAWLVRRFKRKARAGAVTHWPASVKDRHFTYVGDRGMLGQSAKAQCGHLTAAGLLPGGLTIGIYPGVKSRFTSQAVQTVQAHRGW